METTLALLLCGAIYGQPLQFEVATVKLSPPREPGQGQGRVGCYGGAGWRDPIRYVCTNASVSLMVIEAYGVKPYTVRPAVVTDTDRFHVEAKVPPGATEEQVKAMLRHLLAERFKLAFHYEKAEVQGYSLIVAKSGLKMKEFRPPASDESSPPTPPKPVTDSDGFTYIPRRNGMAVGWANGLQRWVGVDIPVDWLAGLLNSLTGRPVIDATGLTGHYDFTLTCSSQPVGESAASPPGLEGGIAPTENAGLTVFAALEKQLGLRLEPRKVALDLFVIDHREKTPIEP